MRPATRPRCAIAMLAAMLVATSCTLPEPCLSHLGPDIKVLPPDPEGIDTADYGTLPVDFMTCRANGGSRVAQLALGHAYAQGTRLPGDDARAAEWYERAATPSGGFGYADFRPEGIEAYGRTMVAMTGERSPGNAAAQYALGLLYLEGRGVAADRGKAALWLERAAGQGHAGAEVALARLDGAP